MNREIKSEPKDYPKLNFPEFLDIWEDWLADRKERRKPVTKRAAEMQLRILEKQPDPVACVKKSIERGYQGIFAIEVKQGDSNKSIGYLRHEHRPKINDYVGTNTAKKDEPILPISEIFKKINKDCE